MAYNDLDLLKAFPNWIRSSWYNPVQLRFKWIRLGLLFIMYTRQSVNFWSFYFSVVTYYWSIDAYKLLTIILFDKFIYLSFLLYFTISSNYRKEEGLAFEKLRSISIKWVLVYKCLHICFIDSSFIPMSTNPNFIK